MHDSACRRLPLLMGGLPLLFPLLLGACAHSHGDAADAEINTPPANYKADILGAMHAYLNDPTGIREAGISAPALKAVGNLQRYVVCVRFNAKKPNGKGYAGVKELAAVFMVGKFDHFAERAGGERAGGEKASGEKDGGEKSGGEKSGGEKAGGERDGGEKASAPCAGATYTPFPELEKLPR